MNSSQELSRASGWQPPFAFGLLICLPLLVGFLTQIFTPGEQRVADQRASAQKAPAQSIAAQSKVAQASEAPTTRAESTATQTTQTQKTAGLAANTVCTTKGKDYPDHATMLVAAFAAEADLATQTEKDSDPIQEASKIAEKPEQQPEPTAEQQIDVPSAENSETEGSNTEDSQPKSDGADAQGTTEVVCCDATSEFEQWTRTLDDNIRKSIVASMTTQLEEATHDLDQKHALIERLQVETELHKMQIQHLRSRIQEWQPIAKDK